MSIIAPISNLSRCSIHDGPGIRTVVYFMGCGMRCKWCHNPENLLSSPKVLFTPIKCIHCGKCLETCHEHHIVRDGEHVYLRENCLNCGKCCDACPTGTLTLCGKNYYAEELVNELKKDKAYFDKSGGGITFSGGECMLYPDFLNEVCLLLEKEGILSCVETALHVPYENIAKVKDKIDAFFCDFKIFNSVEHKKWTGVDNTRIKDNLIRLSHEHKNIHIRIPLIPSVNDNEENFKNTAEFLLSCGEGIQSVELLKYNYMAESKYQIAGMEYSSFGNEAQTNEQMEQYVQKMNEFLQGKIKVFFTK